MKISANDVETMQYLRDRGYTQQAIANMFGCHRTCVEYYTTPGRMDYVKEYSKGRYYRNKIGTMSPREVAKKLK